MYFQKIRHPSNFSFAQSHAEGVLACGTSHIAAKVRDLGEDVFHVELQDAARWPLDPRLLPMLEQAFQGPSSYQLRLDAHGQIRLQTASGETALAGARIFRNVLVNLGGEIGTKASKPYQQLNANIGLIF